MSWFHKIRIREATITVYPYTSRSAMRSAVGADDFGIGSLMISSTDGRMHVKVADNNADADWYKVTTTNTD